MVKLLEEQVNKQLCTSFVKDGDQVLGVIWFATNTELATRFCGEMELIPYGKK